MSNRVQVPFVWPVGYSALAAARNGRVPSAAAIANVAGLLNSIRALRLRQVWHKTFTNATCYTGAGPQVVGWQYWKTPATVRMLAAVVAYVPALPAYLPDAPYWAFNLNGTPGNHYTTQSIATLPAITELMRPRFMACFLPASPSTTYSLEFEVGNGARPLWVSVYEVPYDTIDCDPDSGVGIDPRLFRHGAALHDQGMQRMGQVARGIWEEQGACHFNWSTADGSSIDNATSTWTNILDGDTGGWSSSAAGFMFHPWGRGRRYYNPSVAPASIWYVAESTSNDGELRFSDSSGVIATASIVTTKALSVISANYSTTFTTDLLTVESNGGTGTTKVYGVGMVDTYY